jgi:hypothetical protein
VYDQLAEPKRAIETDLIIAKPMPDLNELVSRLLFAFGEKNII